MKANIFSYLYRQKRARVLRKVYASQARERKLRDLEDAVLIGDENLKSLPRWTYTFPIPRGLERRVHTLTFPSPLTLAAFKDDLSVIDVWMHLGLGGACIKTVMEQAREGNKRPRLQEVSYGAVHGLLNAMGLPGHGVDGRIQELIYTPLARNHRPIGISIGGNSLQEYVRVFNRIHRYIRTRVDKKLFYYEINVSCPNTPEGQQMMKKPELLEQLLHHIRKRTNAVVGVKYSPDASDETLVSLTDLVKKVSLTYVNLGNTSYRRCEEVGLSSHAISLGGGGLSGSSLYPRTLEMTKLIAPLNIPIIATGGINSAQRVSELLSNGATLVGMATAVVEDMYCIPKINRELTKNNFLLEAKKS